MRLKALSFLFIIFDFRIANAMTGGQYTAIQESGFLILWAACIAVAWSIYAGMRGGSLGLPWLIFVCGFTLAAVASLVELLDFFKLVFSEYDFRPFILAARLGSALVLLVGLIFYKRGLE